MIIQNKYVKLIRVQPIHLEQIRSWRNSLEIRSKMEYQDFITENMQKAWFEKINNNSNYFFVIQSAAKLIGLIQLQNLQNHQSESGIFIGEHSFFGTPAPFLASLAILDFGFHFLELTTISAKVKSDNSRAILYNQQLGFQIIDQYNQDFLKMEISKSSYSETCSNNLPFSRFRQTFELISPEEYFSTKQGDFISTVLIDSKQ